MVALQRGRPQGAVFGTVCVPVGKRAGVCYGRVQAGNTVYKAGDPLHFKPGFHAKAQIQL